MKWVTAATSKWIAWPAPGSSDDLSTRRQSSCSCPKSNSSTQLAKRERFRSMQRGFMDGTLDDTLWQLAKPITDFRQKEPHESEPATEKTEVRILYTRHAAYFGIRCYDSEPSKIIATELRRDVSQDLDDHFEILIDSNFNRRGGYVFEIFRRN
jgi:hypothetical protein